MIEKVNGIVEKHILKEDLEYEESYTSSETENILYQQLLCPCFRSYSSLELLSCEEDADEEECRLIKLNNAVKKLLDIIDDPVRREDVATVCCLLCKFLKYNSTDGYYVKHLPMMDEILEFLAMHSKQVDEYLCFLYQLLELCSRDLILRFSSEILDSSPKLQHHASLLGYLLVLAPTRRGFLMAKAAIERLVSQDVGKRRDAVKPDARREAVACSRLPLTLAELAEVASLETYPEVLEMILALVSAAKECCFRMLEAGLDNQLLLRMHPEYQYRFKCVAISDKTNLQLDKEDYYKSLDCSTKILQRLMTSIIVTTELPEYLRCFIPPTREAMWSLRAAFRREVLRASRSAQSRKLRNELANLILTSLVQSKIPWELVESGLAEDLAILAVATELGTDGTWAEGAVVETNSSSGLDFKKILLLIVAMLVEARPDAAPIIKSSRVMTTTLRLLNPYFENTNMPWNSAQLWHLFKYASNALTYLAPKIPEAFIEDNGALRLLQMFQRLIKTIDDGLVTCLAETICSLSLSKCDSILNDFRKHDYASALLCSVNKILNYEALTKAKQTIVTYLLVSAESILENEKCLLDCNSHANVKISVDLLRRCLHQKLEDSELEQSFLVSIGTFIWKCVVSSQKALNHFSAVGGIYLILDLTESANLPVQNLYLGAIVDAYEDERAARCLFSWYRADKKRGLMSLLVNIWREEERTFGVERTKKGCIANVESPIVNDEQWLYMFCTRSVCNLSTIITTAIGPVRPKIYHLRKLITRDVEVYQEDCYKTMFVGLNTEDRITLLTIDAYVYLKEEEAMLEISEILDRVKVRPLSEQGEILVGIPDKLSGWGPRVRQDQECLLQFEYAEEVGVEKKTFEGIRAAKLNAAFDAMEELAFVSRTSCREYRLEKKNEERTMLEEERREAGEMVRTYDVEANVTTVFNQRLKVKSIIKHPCLQSTSTRGQELPIVSSSMSLLSPNVSCCSLATFKSDSSFLLKRFGFDSRGNICFRP